MILPTGLVEDIKSRLNEKELKEFLSLSVTEMIGQHMSLGRYIRNEYGLWKKGSVEKYCPENPLIHPDDLSFYMLLEVQKFMKEEL